MTAKERITQLLADLWAIFSRSRQPRVSQASASEEPESREETPPSPVSFSVELPSKPQIFDEFIHGEPAPPTEQEQVVLEAEEAPVATNPAPRRETGLGEHLIPEEDSPELDRTLRLMSELSLLIQSEYGEGRPHEPKKRRGPGRPRKDAEPSLLPIGDRVKSIGELYANMNQKPKTEMIILITYDITSNKIRKKVSDYLEEIGCTRLQKSVFIGQINRRSYEEIQETLYQLQQTYENEDSIVFLPIPESELLAMRLIGREIDMSFALARQNTLFF